MKATQPVQKNQTLDVTFTDLSHDGAGVAKIEGYTLFVPGGLPGEEAEVKVVSTKKGYGFGKLIRVKKESPERVDPPCEIFDRCGGCQIQHLSRDGQAQFKYKMVSDALERIGGLKDIKVHPVLTMEHPWNYRNKASVPVASRNGEFIAGFYQKRSHFIIDMDHCLITDATVDEVIQEVKRIAKDSGIEPYNEETHRGVLRHIIVRVGKQTGELMVVLVTKTEELPFRKRFIKELPEKFPQIKSIAQNINKKRTNTIFGNDTHILWGRETIIDTIGSVKFAISPRSFYQVNPDQTRVLYEKALEYANLTGDE
ncbi:MAG TPA: 23S rRNA (uracil(1939)-C(5))-methyltransferase RlmD, partial [Sporolactobacillaceae bacterium]|nr:23S rRNA (uracil(1939)-C(5))-methyltransferase RlmD [Sporolactobacillaceae bacterium]